MVILCMSHYCWDVVSRGLCCPGRSFDKFCSSRGTWGDAGCYSVPYICKELYKNGRSQMNAQIYLKLEGTTWVRAALSVQDIGKTDLYCSTKVIDNFPSSHFQSFKCSFSSQQNTDHLQRMQLTFYTTPTIQYRLFCVSSCIHYCSENQNANYRDVCSSWGAVGFFLGHTHTQPQPTYQCLISAMSHSVTAKAKQMSCKVKGVQKHKYKKTQLLLCTVNTNLCYRQLGNRHTQQWC